MVRDAIFETVLINYRLKKPYTWYELRYAVENDNTGIKELIDEGEITTLLRRLNLSILENEKEAEDNLAEIVENIVENDTIILEKNMDKQRMILKIIELIDPYKLKVTFEH